MLLSSNDIMTPLSLPHPDLPPPTPTPPSMPYNLNSPTASHSELSSHPKTQSQTQTQSPHARTSSITRARALTNPPPQPSDRDSLSEQVQETGGGMDAFDPLARCVSAPSRIAPEAPQSPARSLKRRDRNQGVMRLEGIFPPQNPAATAALPPLPSPTVSTAPLAPLPPLPTSIATAAPVSTPTPPPLRTRGLSHPPQPRSTTSSSTFSPSQPPHTHTTSGPTAPPSHAHVPGLGEDIFGDLIGFPTPPPSRSGAQEGGAGLGLFGFGMGKQEEERLDVVRREGRERWRGRWVIGELKEEEEERDLSQSQSQDEATSPHTSSSNTDSRATTPLPPWLIPPSSPSPTPSEPESVEDLAAHRLAALHALEGRALRGAHSFDSVLTARAPSPDTPRALSSLSPTLGSDDDTANQLQQQDDPTLIFDVLQYAVAEPDTSPYEPGELVTALPSSDPRFVLWSPAPSPLAPHRHTAITLPPASAPAPAPRHLLACTPERLIAQLTSSLDYDILLDVLLTARLFLPPAALLRLLIARFAWSLRPGPTHSERDDVVRKIVRLRTMLAVRCWLLTFFRVDFVRDRALRSTLVRWLNGLERDPAVQGREDVVRLVRKLKSVVRECKEVWLRESKAADFGGVASPTRSSTLEPPQADGEAPSATMPTNDPDLDLSDLVVRPSADYERLAGRSPAEEYAHLATYGKSKPVGATSAIGLGARATSPNSLVPLVKPAALSISSSPSATPSPSSYSQHSHSNSSHSRDSFSLPYSHSSRRPPDSQHHSALGRAVLKTMGGLGKLRRAVTARSGAPSCVTGVAGDEYDSLLVMPLTNGGMEQFLEQLVREQSPPPPPHRELPQPTVLPDEPEQEQERYQEQEQETGQETDPAGRTSSEQTPALSSASPTSSEPNSLPAQSVPSDEPPAYASAHAYAPSDSTAVSEEPFVLADPTQRSRTTSVSSLASSIVPAANVNNFVVQAGPPPHVQVISLDELGLSDSDLDSDSEDDGGRPRRLPRRLPLRREFEFMRRSTDTVSSLGVRSFAAQTRDSYASTLDAEPLDDDDDEEPEPALAVQPSGRNPILEGPLSVWHLSIINQFLDSNEEVSAGDPEAALAALEGQVDPSRLQRAWRRGDELISAALEVLQTGAPRPLLVGPDAEYLQRAMGRESVITLSDPHPRAEETPSPEPVPAPPQAPASRPTSGVVSRASTAAPTISPSRPPNVPQSSQPLAYNLNSFIFEYRSEDIAEALCMIDYDMSLNIKFEEIVSLEWYRKVQQEPDVLQWETYLKDRQKFRYAVQQTKKQDPVKLSDIAAVKVRFNLVVHWVAHEVLMTHPSQRVALVNKLIRVAAKAYRMNSFATVVPLVAGLKSPEVTIAMRRHWNHVGVWEMRVFEGLKQFTSSEDHFGHIRDTVTALIDEAGSGRVVAVHPHREARGKGTPGACVPFLGVYVSQLHTVASMPDYIDPTDPTAPVHFDPETGDFNPLRNPQCFSHLPPLPPSVPLEPLINVEKMRKIADIMKNFVAGQHLAVGMKFDVDRVLWQRCLRIRRLDNKELHMRLLAE